jgi:zona occludens toxin (predicted ATPase)
MRLESRGPKEKKQEKQMLFASWKAYFFITLFPLLFKDDFYSLK